MYAWQQPFIEDSDDFLAEVTQYSIFFTLLSALIIKVDVTKEENYSQDLMGVAMVCVNLAAIVLAIFGILYQPLMDLIAMLIKRHKWHIKDTCKDWDENACDAFKRPKGVDCCHHFLFLPSLSTSKESKYYFTNFCSSTPEEAGWERAPQWTGRTPFERDLNEESPHGVKAEWRCRTGNGPYDQARITLTLDIPFDKMRRWVINERDQLLEKELHHHCLKHISDREKIIYKKFKAFRICDDRDAVLHVTNFEEHNDSGQRR